MAVMLGTRKPLFSCIDSCISIHEPTITRGHIATNVEYSYKPQGAKKAQWKRSWWIKAVNFLSCLDIIIMRLKRDKLEASGRRGVPWRKGKGRRRCRATNKILSQAMKALWRRPRQHRSPGLTLTRARNSS